MNIEQYLTRIGYSGKICLHKLHYQHVSSVPFENINPFIDCLVDLNLDRLFERVVLQHQGGGCYELNGLFHALLCKLGFNATLLAAKLFKGDTVDEESLHAIICAEDEGKRWYLDPGYGEDGILYPLEFALNKVQEQDRYFYRFSEQGENWLFSRSKSGKIWQNLLLISPQAVPLSYFDQRALYHQTNSNSWFKNNFTCSLLSETERKTLVNKKYSCLKQVTHLATEEELYTLLTKTFGLNISRDTAPNIFSRFRDKKIIPS